MADWHPMQVSFNGGEITARMINRIDEDVSSSSVQRMNNWMPRLQGAAIRSPGSTFLFDINDTAGRIIPYLDIADQRSLVQITPGKLQVVTGRIDSEQNKSTTMAGAPVLRQQIVGNPSFNQNQGEWNLDPGFYRGGQSAGLGCKYVLRDYLTVLNCQCRRWKFPKRDRVDFRVTQTVSVTYPTDTATIKLRMIYEANPGLEGDKTYTFRIRVGKTAGAGDVFSLNVTGGIGTITEVTETVSVGDQFTGQLYIEIYGSADDFGSHPSFDLDLFEIRVDAPVPVSPDPLDAPYTAGQLNDLHYVQSPYGRKELVIVHPGYPPKWLYYDTSTLTYVFEDIPFVNPPSEWISMNYPSACTAFQGRLILAATPRESETCWGSRPGAWEDFTITVDEDGNVPPDAALAFTSIYRSPIEWVYGHKDLVIGTQEYEYIVQAETGLLQPADIDVRLHSTHGSVHVQPAGFGRFVAFAAERGAKVRAAQANRDNEGWIAPDLTYYADHITARGVRRMMRMRNPHQMLITLLNDGTLALLHRDDYLQINGWSTLDVNGSIQDIAIQQNTEGEDVLYMLVSRTISGRTSLYLEAIFNWSYDRQDIWRYMASNQGYDFPEPTSVITGLEHLEGESVQILADNAYWGTAFVENGQVTVEEPSGEPRPVQTALVGLAMTSTLQMLPPAVDYRTGLESKKRYSTIMVRTVGSTRPIINGERVAERHPSARMGFTQPLDVLFDNEIVNLGWDPYQYITIEEDVPFKCEVISVSGKLASKSL